MPISIWYPHDQKDFPYLSFIQEELKCKNTYFNIEYLVDDHQNKYTYFYPNINDVDNKKIKFMFVDRNKDKKHYTMTVYRYSGLLYKVILCSKTDDFICSFSSIEEYQNFLLLG